GLRERGGIHRLRHVRRVDDRDVVGSGLLGAAAAATCQGDQDRDERKRDQKTEGLHAQPILGSTSARYAADRAAIIASTSRIAPPSSPSRKVTSRWPVEYTAVSTSERRARSSPDPITTGPTDALPPRKTR